MDKGNNRNGILRLDRWLNVPDSYVNNDGKPNLNNSDAENDNNARLAVRNEGFTNAKACSYATHQSCGGLR